METTQNRQSVARRGKHLEYFTIAWNTVEGLVAVGRRYTRRQHLTGGIRYRQFYRGHVRRRAALENVS